MKIVVINGVRNKGCTYKMKDIFLEAMGKGHQITEYNLPKDMPDFCMGCKWCFQKDINVCPHRDYSVPIWKSIKECDLIVITSPVYCFHATGQVKTMLDHYGSKWMVHSPEAELFLKKAVIITNAAGMGLGNVVKDIGVSLDYWGVAKRYAIKQALFQLKWDKVSDKVKAKIQSQCEKVAKKVQKPVKKPRLKIRLMFKIIGIAHKKINKSLLKAGEPESVDYVYWQKHGWLNGVKPWKCLKQADSGGGKTWDSPKEGVGGKAWDNRKEEGTGVKPWDSRKEDFDGGKPWDNKKDENKGGSRFWGDKKEENSNSDDPWDKWDFNK